MATIANVETIDNDSGGQSVRHVWETMGNADDGVPVERHEFVDRSIQIVGSFGGATLTVKGSNDGVNYETLNDLQGNALTLTGAALKGIAEPTRFIKPVTTGGVGTDIDVYMFGKHV